MNLILRIFTLVAVILATSCAAPDKPTIAFYLAVHRDDIDQIKRHIYWGADVNQFDAQGETPLHVAASNGGYVVVELLLKHGANIDEQDRNGQTALAKAILAKKSRVAELLIKRGAKFDPDQLLLLVAASPINDRDMIDLLLNNGASINVVSSDGATPLITAIQAGNRVMAKLLIAAGADVNLPGGNDITPLEIAENKGNTDIIRLLQRNGASKSVSP